MMTSPDMMMNTISFGCAVTSMDCHQTADHRDMSTFCFPVDPTMTFGGFSVPEVKSTAEDSGAKENGKVLQIIIWVSLR